MIANKDKVLRKLGRMFKTEGPPDSPELRRILTLPRRVWETDEIENIGTVEDLVAQLTAFCKTPQGSWVLHTLQAKILQEAHDIGGCFCPVPVGDGKTIVTLLAPWVLQAERPLLVIPAKLRKKTYREFDKLSEHWKRHPDIQIVSYEKISRSGGTEYLAARNPDLFLFDEFHRLKNKNAAVTRRFTAWMEEKPETKVIGLSGTVTDRSLRDFAHLLPWCLPPGLLPLPQTPLELEAWAAAVDEIKASEKRMAGSFGALVKFCPDAATRVMFDRSDIRKGVRDRIQQTPGVVASKGKPVNASLNIEITLVEGYSSRTLRLAQGLLEGEKPNGEPITDEDLSTRWRVTRTLTSGFWYTWDPMPPPEWMAARSAWKKTARSFLQRHLPGLESEALVARAANVGKLTSMAKDHYGDWAAIRGTFKPNTVPVWEDDRMLRAIERWTKKHRGIIWVSEVALGQRLERDLGLPYYHQMGLDSRGDFIEDDEGKTCIVASISANGEGRNLQHVWHDNLVISPPPNGKVWEQLLGREHRQGQEADEVDFEVFVGCEVEWECWQQAMRDARTQSDLENPKKLTYATVTELSCPYGDNALWPTAA